MTNAPSGTPSRILGTIQGMSDALVTLYSPAYQYATAVRDDSASRTTPSAARNSFFARPWLFSMMASGGPEIVVTEYKTPSAPPNPKPTARSDLSGRL
jgi:hypothetical protein